MFWYIFQSWDAMTLLVPKPIILFCFLNFLVALVFNFPHKNRFDRKKSVLLYSPGIFPIVLWLWGILSWSDNTDGGLTSEWITYVAMGIYLFLFLWAGFVAFKLKGYRWYSISFSLLVTLYSLGILFVAGMAITGDWL